MNTTASDAPQASSFPAHSAFPQPVPASLLAMSASAAISAILDLFDSGAIDGGIAEDWLVHVENLQQTA